MVLSYSWRGLRAGSEVFDLFVNDPATDASSSVGRCDRPPKEKGGTSSRHGPRQVFKFRCLGPGLSGESNTRPLYRLGMLVASGPGTRGIGAAPREHMGPPRRRYSAIPPTAV